MNRIEYFSRYFFLLKANVVDINLHKMCSKIIIILSINFTSALLIKHQFITAFLQVNEIHHYII